MRFTFVQTASRLALLFILLGETPLVSESCDPIRTFADGKTPLREIFVSPNGDNSTGDGARDRPFRTLERAAQNVRPGDAIRLLPGAHDPGSYLENVAGTADAPIWLGGVPGAERPVFRGGSQAMHLSRVRYLIVENIEIDGASQNGINCDDGGEYANPDATRHILFRNLLFHNIGSGGNQDALKLSGVDDYLVIDCAFERTSAGGSGIDHVGCHQGLIARCRFTDIGSNAIQCKGGSEDIEIGWNRFINGGERAINIGGSTGFQFFRPPLSQSGANAESRDIRVIANMFQGSTTPVAFVGTVNSLVANNTIVAPERWLMRILQETVSGGGYEFLPSGGNRFVNNLVYFDRSQISAYVNIGANTAPESFVFRNNLWHAFDQPSRSRPALPSEETGGLYGLDPLFKDADNADYTLLPGSPASGKGARVEEAKADLLERCFANPPSIGAFEPNPAPAPRADADGDRMPDEWEEAKCPLFLRQFSMRMSR